MQYDGFTGNPPYPHDWKGPVQGGGATPETVQPTCGSTRSDVVREFTEGCASLLLPTEVTSSSGNREFELADVGTALGARRLTRSKPG
jgi:hypothetical protein